MKTRIILAMSVLCLAAFPQLPEGGGAGGGGSGGSGSIPITTLPLKGNGSGGATDATAADIVGIFTGCTSGYLKFDGTCSSPAGSGDFSSNTGTSVDSEVVIFSGTGGKTGKRATGTGFAKLTSGVLSAGSIAAGDVPAALSATTSVNGTTIPSSVTLVKTTDTLAVHAATTSSQLAGVLSDETGSGLAVFATSPVLTTPNLGTPSAVTLTSATGLPISTGVSGLGTGVATALATPSSANLVAAVTDETGTGALVFGTSPTLTTPNIGVATATSVNGTTIPSSVTLVSTNATNTFGSSAVNDARSAAHTLPAKTGIASAKPATCTTGEEYFATDATAGQNKYYCTATNTWTQQIAGGGSGTVTVVSSGSLTSTALVTGGGTTTLQTPSATATMDSSGNISTPGSITSGAGGSTAGMLGMNQGTANTPLTNEIVLQAPTSVTAYSWTFPSAAATGFVLGTNSSGVVTLSQVASTGSGSVVLATSPTLVTPVLGAATATTINGTTIPSSVTLAQTIASGTAALGTSAISSGACATVVTSTATGGATTDILIFTPNADITAVTGYAPVTTGGLAIYPYVTTNTANFKVCNPTSSSITPGAVTLNWRITR